ncbi:MAG TPA: ankyrin repeat domain-containing protein [Armatimonadota bacterium]|nr:ankyrin repeat domain-containing protein [Armatimonadota bacterium]
MPPRRAWEPAFHYAARTGDLDTLLSTLRGGHDPDQRDQRGNTALALAAQHGHAQVVRTLLAHGADVDREVKWHHTPLVLAVMWSHTDIALLLMDHGAGVHQVSAIEGRSVFSLAVINRLQTVVKALLQRGADPNHRDARGRTALSYAREMDHSEMMQLLSEAGAQA